MSDEEKKAIENMKSLLLYSKEHEYFSPFQEQEIDDMNVVLNIIEKQSKEIEHQKEKRENQKLELAILNAKQIEFNKLVNAVKSYKGQFKRQQKEIEELYQDNLTLIQEINQRWLDKIKAKIEELEKLDFGTDLVSQFTANLTTITILQSLLQEEENNEC